MKLVQSFWSLPSLGQGENPELLGGWPSERAHALSWALSYQSLRKQHPSLKISLYTDKIGKGWLIDKLGLGYDEVFVDLESLADQNPKLWALGKIKTYSLQNEAFLHVDGDVFIWDAFDRNMMAKPLIAQNLEFGHDTYQETLRWLRNRGIEIDFDTDGNAYSVNAGILGGHDVSFFKLLSQEIFEFVSRTRHIIDELPSIGYYNMFFEQYLFAQIAIKENYDLKTIGTVLTENEGFLHNLTRFGLVPQIRKYIHMIGESKSKMALNRHLESRLLHEFPACYERLDGYYQQKTITFPNNNGCLTQTTFFNCQRELKRLGHPLNQFDSSAIEQILEKHFDDERYDTLWDFYQLENSINDLNKHACTRRYSDINVLYNLSVDSFLSKRFEMNRLECQIIFLYGLFPTTLELKQLDNLQQERINPQKGVAERQNLCPYLFDHRADNYQVIPLSNWFSIYLSLSEDAVTGHQICKHFSTQAESSGIDLKIGVYEFLSAQCFIYNRIKLIQ